MKAIACICVAEAPAQHQEGGGGRWGVREGVKSQEATSNNASTSVLVVHGL